jgi:DNA-binding HxlR family transcriptional regulator
VLMTATAHDASLCPTYHRAIELIGRRWSGAILQVMRGSVARFSDIATAIPGLSDRMLSERLKELESEGLIERIVYPETPVRVEYRLTPAGEALGTVLDAVLMWAHDWLVQKATSIDDPDIVTEAGTVPAVPRRAVRA